MQTSSGAISCVNYIPTYSISFVQSNTHIAAFAERLSKGTFVFGTESGRGDQDCRRNRDRIDKK